MNRRTLLLAGASTTAAAAAAALAWPGWLRQAFAGREAAVAQPPITPETEPCQGAMRRPPQPEVAQGKCSTPREPSAALEQAKEQARAQGKKLLILAIPDDISSRFQRGRLFGEYLNHGSDKDLSPLASAVVACAALEQVNKALGSSLQGDPALIVVDPRDGSTRALEARTSQTDLFRFNPGEDFQARERRLDLEISKHIEAVAALVEQALGPAPEAEIAARAASVREALVKCPPPGARWASSSGCGTHYEDLPDDKQSMVSCGMGNIPKRSQRFIELFSATRAG